jgi:hypothetical protein
LEILVCFPARTPPAIQITNPPESTSRPGGTISDQGVKRAECFQRLSQADSASCGGRFSPSRGSSGLLNNRVAACTCDARSSSPLRQTNRKNQIRMAEVAGEASLLPALRSQAHTQARKAGGEVGRRSLGQCLLEMAAGGLPTICNAEPRKAVCDCGCEGVSSVCAWLRGGGRRGILLRAWFQHGLRSDISVISERGEVMSDVPSGRTRSSSFSLSYTEEVGGGSFLGRPCLGDGRLAQRVAGRRSAGVFGAQTVKMMSTRVCWRDLTAACLRGE